jgi:hypothetical protein
LHARLLEAFDLPSNSNGAKNNFDLTLANTSVYLSSAAYCDTSTYMNRTYIGPSTGFIPYSVIDDREFDTHGYIGYRTEDETIYIVFRGSEDIENWIENIRITFVDYPYCKECQVHKGWYNTYKNVMDQIMLDVSTLNVIFPSYKVVVTGHSLGAALASLTAVDLQMVNSNVQLYNYGCPRVGNEQFSNWFSDHISNHYRVTHHKDIVPHVPTHERYTHFDGEWYHESNIDASDLKECTNGPEDPSCAYQWTVTSVSDHMIYLGLNLGCDGVSG